MKLCAAQTEPIKGNIVKNIADHMQFIETAVSHHANFIIFPELSLTGYEPTLAQDLATTQDDSRLDVFQNMSNQQDVTIGVGIPTKGEAGLHISIVLFQPNHPRRTYNKKYLHADEEPFFVSGPNFPTMLVDEIKIAPAICYEISVKQHAKEAYAHGANVYFASVAKSASGVEQASSRLKQIAKKYDMHILMSNCVGPSEDFVSAGNTAVWNHKGKLLAQLDDEMEGMLIFDTETQAVTAVHH